MGGGKPSEPRHVDVPAPASFSVLRAAHRLGWAPVDGAGEVVSHPSRYDTRTGDAPELDHDGLKVFIMTCMDARGLRQAVDWQGRDRVDTRTVGHIESDSLSVGRRSTMDVTD